MPDPAQTYRTRRDASQRVLDRLTARLSQLGLARLVAFAALAAAGVASWQWPRLLLGVVAMLALATFIALIIAYARTRRARISAARSVGFYTDGLARTDGTWPGGGVSGERFADDAHPYAADLDLFGTGSLYERLCTARSAVGQETLASWLLAPASIEEIRARHAAIRELEERLDLREDLALLAGDTRGQLHGTLLSAWATQAPALTDAWRPVAAWGIGAASMAAAIAWAMGASPIWLGACVLVGWLASRGVHDRLGAIARESDAPGRELALLSRLLGRFEAESFESEKLVKLRADLVSARVPASVAIGRLGRLLAWLEAMRNPFFVIIGWLLLWTVHFGYAIERWRARHGAAVPRWLEAMGELEALCALAAYAFENPNDTFPEVLPEDTPRFEATALTHPLLGADAVRNDVRFEPPVRLWVVSGSNMSGKTTLLRSVGTAVVLGLAGAPVRASALVLSPMSLGATLRVQDSIQEGISRFYAELRRLRTIVDLASGGPTLFLLDEIMAGTNSHDRRIGAAAVVRTLIDHNAIGLVTTHDLALARTADELGERARNVHFVDDVTDGQIHFDYRLHEGVVTRSNALELMRTIGLVE